MRRSVGKSLRSQFDKRIKKERQNIASIKGDMVPPGSRAYAFELSTGLLGVVVLVLDPKYDYFTLEFGWSDQNRFPGCYTSFKPAKPEASEHRIRLGFLIPESRKDHWWELQDFDKYPPHIEFPVEESLTRLGPALDEAFGMIKELGIPFLEEIARQKEEAKHL